MNIFLECNYADQPSAEDEKRGRKSEVKEKGKEDFTSV